ncbi:MAG: hypothetical protein R2856_13005 [Caldilineaceae bacterium]
MITGDGSGGYLSDRERDARKYGRLVRTLNDLTGELKTLLQSNPFDVERFLLRLLPHYTHAFEAEDSFLLRLTRQNGGLQVVEIVHVSSPLWSGSLPSDLMLRLYAQNRAQVINANQPRYRELASLGLHDAIVAPLHALIRIT